MLRRPLVTLALLGPLLGGCDRFRTPPTPPRPRAVLPTAVTLNPTEDGWVLAATLTDGEQRDRAVVLVHQLASDRREWEPLLHRLRAPPAVTTLAVDLRGHGDSLRGPLGEGVQWTRFGTDPTAWGGVVKDVQAAVAYLAQQGVSRVVFVGSSLGASACVGATAGAVRVDGLVLLSPGLNYHGLEVRPSFASFLRAGGGGRRALVLGAAGDPPAAEAVPALAALGPGRVDAELFAGERRHGVSLCNARPARWDRVETFIRDALDARRPVAAPTAPAARPAGAR
ncbi:MAG: alpha/beta fold hydrolase [Polyangiales bacterium]